MLDWDDLRFFLALSRHRSLAATAKLLHVTQSTVGRRLAALEAGMGARLLHRVTGGYALTLAGQAILENVERMEGEALQLEKTVGGHDTRLSGVVRVTGSQIVTSHLLAPCLAVMHASDRNVMVELLPLMPNEAIAQREADIAVQLRPFEHQDLIVRRLGCIAFGLYGSADYLERSAYPDIVDGLAGHQLITMLDDRESSTQAAWLSEHGGRGDVVLRSDTYETQHCATASGGGLAVLPRFRADAEPTLRLVPISVSIPAADIWMGVHKDNRTVSRVRTVLDCIADTIHAKAATLDPPAKS